jgi:filamentous hemagglutinin
MKVAPHNALRRSRTALFAGLALLLSLAPGARAGNVNWTLAGNGDWDTAANWSSNPNLPGPADNVTNNSAYTITHSTGTDTVASFTSNGGLTLAGGNLAVTGNLQVNNAITLDGGEISDATLLPGTGGSIVLDPDGTLTGNILNDVTLPGGLTLAATPGLAGWCHLTGGTTFGPNAAINIGAGVTLDIDNQRTDTLTGETITFAGGGYLATEPGETLILDPTTTVLSTGGDNDLGIPYLTSGATTLINNGTITANAGSSLWVGWDATQTNFGTYLTNASGATMSAAGAGSDLTIAALTFTNAGNILDSAGTASITAASFTDTGSIIASAGGTLTISTTNEWLVGGPVQANGTSASGTATTVKLGGIFSLPSGSTPLTTSAGGQMLLTGTLDVSGAMAGAGTNFDPTTSIGGTANFAIDGGTISGGGVGTITHSSSLVFASGQIANGSVTGFSTLSAVALDGGLNLNTAWNGGGGGWVQLTGGTTLGPNPTIDLGSDSVLVFDNAKSETLNGATIQIAGGAMDVEGGETLTLGPTTVISATAANSSVGGVSWTGSGSSTLINEGTITSDQGSLAAGNSLTTLTNAAGGVMSAVGSGSSLTIDPSTFTNAGSVLASGGSVTISPGKLANTGSIIASDGGAATVVIGNWVLGGTIQANGTSASGAASTVDLAGGGIGLPSNSSNVLSTSAGGQIVLTGELDLAGDLAGSVTSFDPTTSIGGTGSFVVNGGEISGGSLTHASDIVFTANVRNVLSDDSVNGGLNLSGSILGLNNTTVAPNSTINLANGALLAFDDGSATLNGATINMGSPFNGGSEIAIQQGTLTLGPTTVLSGGYGFISGQYFFEPPYMGFTATLINEGTITSNGGNEIVIGPSSSFVAIPNGHEQPSYIGGGPVAYLTNAAGATMSAAGAGSELNIEALNFTNAGNVLASGSGAVTIGPNNYSSGSGLVYSGAFTTTGNIIASSGGTVNFELVNEWQPGGVIQANGTSATGTPSAVSLGGTFSLPANSSTILSTSAGGQMLLTGDMDLSGKVAGSVTNFDPTTGIGGTDNFIVDDGDFTGGGVGTITHSSSLVFASGYGTEYGKYGIWSALEGVALDGGLNLNTAWNGYGGWVYMADGTTLGPDPTIDLGNASMIVFANQTSEALNGATIDFGGSVPSEMQVWSQETLTLAPTTVISGGNGYISGITDIDRTSTLINEGTITSNTGGFLTVGTGVLTVSSGTLTVLTNASSGTMSANGAGSTLTIQPQTFTNAGEILAVNGGAVTINPTNALVNQGTVDAEAGSTITLYNYSQSAGQLIANGTVSQAAGTIDISGGKVTGAGTIQGSLANTGGAVSAGSPNGTLTVTGSYTQGLGGTMVANIGGETAGTGYSVLAVNGSAALDGTIEVDFVNGFAPKPGDTFDVMTYSNVSGNFRWIDAVDYNNIQVELFPTYAEIVVTPGPDSLLVLAAGLVGVGTALRRRARR